MYPHPQLFQRQSYGTCRAEIRCGYVHPEIPPYQFLDEMATKSYQGIGKASHQQKRGVSHYSAVFREHGVKYLDRAWLGLPLVSAIS